MSLTFHQIVVDAKKLVLRITDHEVTTDNLIGEIQSICSQLDNMKQYREEVDILNSEAKQRPRMQIIAQIQQENKHLHNLEIENKELKNALEDHQNAIDLIMSKYREQTSSLIRRYKPDLAALHNTKYANIITCQAEKINEMVAVMKTAAAVDENQDLQKKEALQCLKKENTVLRELVNIANKCGSLNQDLDVEDKMIQTDSL